MPTCYNDRKFRITSRHFKAKIRRLAVSMISYILKIGPFPLQSFLKRYCLQHFIPLWSTETNKQTNYFGTGRFTVILWFSNSFYADCMNTLKTGSQNFYRSPMFHML